MSARSMHWSEGVLSSNTKLVKLANKTAVKPHGEGYERPFVEIPPNLTSIDLDSNADGPLWMLHDLRDPQIEHARFDVGRTSLKSGA